MPDSATLPHVLMDAAERAAVAIAPLIGSRQPEQVDGAAVDAMRAVLDRAPFSFAFTACEGARDDSPGFEPGARYGKGGAAWSLAADPVDGTRVCSEASGSCLTCIMAAAPGTLMRMPDVYAEQLVVRGLTPSAVKMEGPLPETLRAVADALGLRPRDLIVAWQPRERNQRFLDAIKSVGATPREFVTSLAEGFGVLTGRSPAHLMWSVMGGVECLMLAGLARAAGGDVQMRLSPADERQREWVGESGLSFETAYGLDQLCNTQDVYVAATGVITSDILPGVVLNGAPGKPGKTAKTTKSTGTQSADLVTLLADGPQRRWSLSYRHMAL